MSLLLRNISLHSTNIIYRSETEGEKNPCLALQRNKNMEKEKSYFEGYLRRYLKENNILGLMSEENILARSEKAEREFEEQRLAGAGVFGAEEIAIRVLMENIPGA